MDKKKEFEAAKKTLDTKMLPWDDSARLMSDINNWCFVHTTDWFPKSDANGDLYIETRSMATDFKSTLRTTVHATLNHVVTSHAYGSWDEKSIVILAPYNDITDKNGNPAEVSGMDTYWSVSPDKGLLLPKSTYIIKPDNNGPLFQIGEHGATYKRDNYTDDEIAQLESIMNKLYQNEEFGLITPHEFEEYMDYKDGIITDWAMEHEFRGKNGDIIKKAYEQATDKRAFWRGIFSEKRFESLSRFLRDILVKMSMQKIGKSWVYGISDSSHISEIISDTATAKGLRSTPSNKGHSGSVYGQMEWFDGHIKFAMDEIVGAFDKSIKEKNIEPLINMVNMLEGMQRRIINSIFDQKQFHEIYQDEYHSFREGILSACKSFLEDFRKTLSEIENNSYLSEERKATKILRQKELISFYEKEYQNFLSKKTIADYDKNLWETILRKCEWHKKWYHELTQNPEYVKIINEYNRRRSWDYNKEIYESHNRF